MNLTEGKKIVRKTKRNPCTGNSLSPFEYEYTSISCGKNVIKRKIDLIQSSRKKIYN